MADPGETQRVRWLRECAAATGTCVVSGVLFRPALVVALVMGLVTLVVMFLAAREEFGRGYAWRHVVLALLLGLVFGLGLVVVPLMVDSDIAKTRGARIRAD